MSKTKQQKKQIVEELENEFQNSSSTMFVDYYGLNVSDAETFRKMTKKAGCKYLVAKKSLLKIALKNTEFDESWADNIKGGAGLVFGYERPIEPARVISEFQKEHGNLEPQGGIFEKNFIKAETVKELAKLPTYKELLTKLVLTIKAPVNNFVYALNGNMSNLVCALSNIRDNKKS